MADPFERELLEGAALFEQLALPDACDLARVTSVDDGFGGQTETETALASGVPCSYAEQFSVAEQEFVARRGVAVAARLLLPAGQDVIEGDRVTALTVGDTALVGGAVAVLGSYEVRAVVRRSRNVKTTCFIGRLT